METLTAPIESLVLQSLPEGQSYFISGVLLLKSDHEGSSDI